MSDEMTQTTETTTETTATVEIEPQATQIAQPEEQAVGNDDLLAFLSDAQEKQTAERAAREAAKKAAAAAQNPQMTQAQQPIKRSEPLIAAEAHAEIMFLRELEPKLRGLDSASLEQFEAMLRKRWASVSTVVLGECLKYRVEHFLGRAKEAKRVPDPIASMLLHWGFARPIDRQAHEASIECWKIFGGHKREVKESGDRNHNQHGNCKACQLPPFTSWESLDGTLFAIDLKRGGEKERYAGQISRVLDDWRRASSSARGAVAEACRSRDAEQPNSTITLASMARGDAEALGKTVAIVVPRELAIFHHFTDRESGEEKSIPYRGVFFVHMLSPEEQAKHAVRVPKGWAAIGLDAPGIDEDAGKLEKPFRDVLGDKNDPKILLFNSSDPRRPFDMLQDSRTRMTPKINWGTVRLQDYLMKFLTGRRVADEEMPTSPVAADMPQMPPQQHQPPRPEKKERRADEEHEGPSRRGGGKATHKEKGGGHAQRWG